MADTTFVAQQTITSIWLNVINNLVYRGRNPNFATTTGAANAQILTLATGSLYTSVTAGDSFPFLAGFTNSGAMTLQVIAPGGSLAAAAVQLGGQALTGGEVIAGQNYIVTRIGATWQLTSLAGTAFSLALLQLATAATWRTALGAMQNVITTRGDLVRGGAGGVPQRLALGTSGQVVSSDGTDVVWSTPTTAAILNDVCDFRLSLTTALPVTTSDVTGATSVFATQYKGNRIALYDGVSAWNVRSSAEFSLALGTLTSGKPYDIFCYDNATVPTLEFLVWTNDTTRATALTLQDGVLVKTGATTRRYLGTFYTTSTTQTEDSLAKRNLWNYYNRVARPMKAVDTTDSWAYGSTTFRQARATATNQLEFVVGVAEEMLSADVYAASSSSSDVNSGCGIGIDSTSVNSAITYGLGTTLGTVVQATHQLMTARYRGYPTAGRHTAVWLESGETNITFYGDNGTTTGQSGITGQING